MYEPFDRYPFLREILDPRLENASDEQIEGIVRRRFGAEVSAEDLEDFASGLKSFGSSLGRAAPSIATGAVSGATAGAALGPWGMLGGALLGGTLGYLGAQQPGGQPQPGPAAPPPAALIPAHPPLAALPPLQPSPPPLPPPPPAPVAAEPTPAAPAPAAPGGEPVRREPSASPAAAQLLSLMLHQETLLALLALVFGRAGRQDVPVGRALVPVGAFPNAIRVLADQVSAEQFARVGRQTQAEGIRYMMDAEGSYVGDPADPAARTGRLLELLQQADAETMRARSAEAAWQTAEFQESLAEDYEVDVEAEAFEAEPEAVDDWLAGSLPLISG